jgi:SAM-dependent methyltransferase
LTWRLYGGDAVECPCCSKTFRGFQTFDDDRRCPACGSLARHRLVWLFLEREVAAGRVPRRLLHFAPEYGLRARLRGLPGLDYVTADLDSSLADTHFDICDIPFDDESFDAVICCHVLEHVEDDLRAMKEVLRILQPGGWAILQSPVELNLPITIEDPTITDPRAREILFGQYDHFRRYGADYAERVSGVGYDVCPDELGAHMPRSLAERYGIDPAEPVYLCRKPPRDRATASNAVTQAIPAHQPAITSDG